MTGGAGKSEPTKVGGTAANGAALSGYLHPAYAAALADYGRPRELSRAGGRVLERCVPGRTERDAVGCYPLFCCRDWTQLRADLEDLSDDLITLAAVTDPFGGYDEAYLHECFHDVVLPFKEHYVVDLSRAPEDFVHPHHRRNARRARAALQVERARAPLDLLADWTALYAALVARHGIRGVAAFSPASFAAQFTVPGLVVLRAHEDGSTVGLLLWYVLGEVAYYHLGAYNARGYELRASFALFSYALEHFAQMGLRYLNLGGGAGTRDDTAAGLRRFKAGWANETRTAYFCGRIFDRARYDEIVRAQNVAPTNFFPAYRAGEF